MISGARLLSQYDAGIDESGKTYKVTILLKARACYPVVAFEELNAGEMSMVFRQPYIVK